MVQGHLFWEAICCNELERLHLSKVGGVTKHVDIHKLCNVAVSVGCVLVFEGIPECCTFLGNDGPFFCSGLALPHSPDQLPAGVPAHNFARLIRPTAQCPSRCRTTCLSRELIFADATRCSYVEAEHAARTCLSLLVARGQTDLQGIASSFGHLRCL